MIKKGASKKSFGVDKGKIYAYALENAINHEKAQVNSVLGKLFLEGLEKSEVKKIIPSVQEAVDKVNKMVPAERQKEFEKAKELVKERVHKQREGLPELEGAQKGKVVMRMAPSASGPLHIGHAYPLSLNAEYCRMYGGKLIIRIEDTNPENIDPIAYNLIPEDAQWLTENSVSKVYVQSDRMDIYYKHAERVLKEGNAYVCTCSQEDFKIYSEHMEECPCRNLSAEDNLGRWKRMFLEKEGWGVVRIKTVMTHKNPALRDWPALRINLSKHPRVGNKYKVWPLMNFAVTVDDVEMGVTHTLRGKDHYDNAMRQEYLFNYLGVKPPVHLFVGRINFEGLSLSTSEAAESIRKKKYSGWDDIRLPFLLPLRKRGYRPQAMKKFYVNMGVGMNDKTVKKEEYFQLIDSFNKEIINSEANRYFFVADPVKIKIENAPELNVEIGLHPEFEKRGKRKFKTSNEFYISKSDVPFKEGKIYRLMECFNFTKKGNKLVFHSKNYEEYKENGEKIMHWLPADKKQIAPMQVKIEDGEAIKGLAEKSVNALKIETAVQFERFGFCIKRGKDEFWFTHR